MSSNRAPKAGHRGRAFALALALTLLVGCLTALAQDVSPSTVSPVPVFDIPRIVGGQRLAAGLIQVGDLGGAEKILNGLVARYPSLAILKFELAVLKLRQNLKDEAIKILTQAVDAGLPKSILEAPAFTTLRNEPAYQELLTKAGKPPSLPAEPISPPAPQPAEVGNHVAMVDATNTIWDPRLGMLRALFHFSSDRNSTDKDRDISEEATHNAWFALAAARLNGWLHEGTAAGNYGDLYDNRDGEHSLLPPEIFPELTRIQYSEAARRAGLDRGFNRYFLYNAVTIGNASLALTSGPMWRSLPRMALTDRLQVDSLYQEYSANHLYVYPAHKDYGTPAGDLITANTPYMLISSGSSGTDQPLLKAVAAILAAFKPEVKAFLREKGLISPTVQWIFRRGQLGIDSDDDYLTGRAHPSAFNGKRINLLDMVERAHSLDAGDVPPMVRLSVKDEDHGTAGIDVMYPSSDDALFDTPSAIARIFRSTDFAKRMVVDASPTTDPNNRPLTFRWVVLRGDSKQISIRPMNDQGSVAEITIPWNARRVGADNITGDRVEIGVFANNGKHWSAPAFISVIFQGNESRIYRPDAKIAEVDYADQHQHRYVDPVLFPVRDWHDVYRYDGSGQLLGWTRSRDGATSKFTAEGTLVIESDQVGRPVRTERVRYRLHREADGGFRVIEEPTGVFVSYTYQGDADMTGTKTETERGLAAPQTGP